MAGEVQFGVLPIESTLAGPIAETHDLLQASPLAIGGEIVLRVRHCSSASSRCRSSGSRSSARIRPRSTSAGGCWRRCRGRRRSPPARRRRRPPRSPSAAIPTEAAIAGERAAAVYGLSVIAEDVGDHAETYTQVRLGRDRTRGSTPRARTGGRRSRSSPTTGPARSTTRSSRSRCTASISSSSSRGRSPTPRGATASTPCSPAIRSTRRSGRLWPRSGPRTRRLKVFGSYPARGGDV